MELNRQCHGRPASTPTERDVRVGMAAENLLHERVTLTMSAFVPAFVLKQCFFNAPLHNKRVKIKIKSIH